LEEVEKRMKTNKELEMLERVVDRIQNKVDRIEQKLTELEINEVIVKGREILKIYKQLQQVGVVDVYKIRDEVLQLKQTLTYIQYHPWEWLQRDPVASKAFLSKVHKIIADEIRQAALFTLYQENPQVVVRVVKDTVKEYLDVWEVNNQVAREIVSNVLKNSYFKEIAHHITTTVMSTEFKREFLKQVVDVKELYEAKQLLETEG